MELIRGLHNLKSHHQGCVATIGNFDGVHGGHQVILEQVKAKAAELSLPTVAMVFEPQPQEFFNSDDAPARLTWFAEKMQLLEKQNIDRVLILPFPKIRHLNALQFINDVLVSGLGLKHLVVGDDFRFGCDRQGDFQLLKKSGAELGFSVEDTGSVLVNEQRVSSTLIREQLAAGDFQQAQQLLNRPYTIGGRIIRGAQLGRQLGVPTANILLKRKKVPLRGVFAVKVHGLGQTYQGVANVGSRPTVDGVKELLEVHLFDFDQDVYGQTADVEFCNKLRAEQKFDSIDLLKEQIYRDIEQAQQFFGI